MKRVSPRGAAPSSGQLPLFAPEEHERSRLSLAELEALIARYEDELSTLKKLRRSKLGGLAAAGRPRTPKFNRRQVLEAYANACGPDDTPVRGARRRTAERFGMSERHLGRLLSEHRDELEQILRRASRRRGRASG